MMKVIFFIILIVFAIWLFIKLIQGKNGINEKSTTKMSISPPNYRVSPWNPDWIRPYYKCDGCEYGHLRRFMNGEFRTYCSRYNIIDNNCNCVCDDYVECDPLPSFRDPDYKFIPIKGHLDRCPYENK